jgi:hypothetical protein
VPSSALNWHNQWHLTLPVRIRAEFGMLRPNLVTRDPDTKALLGLLLLPEILVRFFFFDLSPLRQLILRLKFLTSSCQTVKFETLSHSAGLKAGNFHSVPRLQVMRKRRLEAFCAGAAPASSQS